jgi:polysaccharide pyruvyl transferase WcaK-like protein
MYGLISADSRKRYAIRDAIGCQKDEARPNRLLGEPRLMFRRRRAQTERVTMVGHFGAGNIGNECTLQASIEQISRLLPQAALQCACTIPQDVAERHRIPAYAWNRTVKIPATVGADKEIGSRRRQSVFVRLLDELGTYAVCLRTLWRSDILVICGTNVVSDFMTGPKGWPYDLFKWSALAALFRVKVVFIGVGVGPIYHTVSRWLIKQSFGFAAYRSYRDEISRGWAKKIGVNTNSDVVCPDLVFGLSLQGLKPIGVRTGTKPLIGVGLKDYQVDFKADYQSYIDTMVTYVGWLLEMGYDVRLLVGDLRYDVHVIQDVLAGVKHRFPEGHDRILADPALTTDDLIGQIEETEAVVSPRFHNLVLGLMLNKPVIALSDQHKLDTLMGAFELSKYCLSLDNLSVNDLKSSLLEALADRLRLKAEIRTKVAAFRLAVEAQFKSSLTAAGAATDLAAARRIESVAKKIRREG